MMMEGGAAWLPEWSLPWPEWIHTPLFSVGETSFTPTSLLKLLVFILAVAWMARLLRRLLVRRVLPRFGLESGVTHALGEIVHYLVVTVGLLVGLQAAGIDLSTLTVLAGALGVGIGFGLQTIASNFVSGLIILLERPIQVGDRIQVGELDGKVMRVRMRATEILTNDAISVIVPNSEIVSQSVVNWSHSGNSVRLHVPVGVAYGSDPEKVRRALLEAAANVDAVLRDPPPKVWFLGFGDSSLNFELLAWTSELLHNRGEFTSRVCFAIYASLQHHGVQIPFPQRDLHLRTPVAVAWSPPPT